MEGLLFPGNATIEVGRMAPDVDSAAGALVKSREKPANVRNECEWVRERQMEKSPNRIPRYETINDIGGENVKSKESEKLLGVQVSANLDWNTHVNKLCTTLKQRLGLMRRIKHKIRQHNFVALKIRIVRIFFKHI